MSEETHKKEHGEKHLEKLTIKELREIAAEIPHERAIHDMKKEELVAFIKEARGIKDRNTRQEKEACGQDQNDQIGAQSQNPRTESLERAGARI